MNGRIGNVDGAATAAAGENGAILHFHAAVRPKRPWLAGSGGVIPMRRAVAAGQSRESQAVPSWFNPLAVALALLAAAGQAGAFLTLETAGDASPWLLAAVFGAAAAAESQAIRLLPLPGGCASPAETALGDPFTVALLLMATAVTGGSSAALLLPVSWLTTSAVLRTVSARKFDSDSAMLILATLIVLAALCHAGGWNCWLASGAVVLAAAAGLIREGAAEHGGGLLSRNWQIACALCAAAAAAGYEQGGTPPALWPMALAGLAGLAYGLFGEAAARVPGKGTAIFAARAVPFLAAGAEAALHGIGTEQLAAAVLLAALLFAWDGRSARREEDASGQDTPPPRRSGLARAEHCLPPAAVANTPQPFPHLFQISSAEPPP